jgi:hypothetical protein
MRTDIESGHLASYDFSYTSTHYHMLFRIHIPIDNIHLRERKTFVATTQKERRLNIFLVLHQLARQLTAKNQKQIDSGVPSS